MSNKTVLRCGPVFVQFHGDKVEEAFTACWYSTRRKKFMPSCMLNKSWLCFCTQSNS